MAEYVVELTKKQVSDLRRVRRERVTRCRDCAHWRRPSDRERSRCTGAMAFVEPTPDGFCSWAKPREGA